MNVGRDTIKSYGVDLYGRSFLFSLTLSMIDNSSAMQCNAAPPSQWRAHGGRRPSVREVKEQLSLLSYPLDSLVVRQAVLHYLSSYCLYVVRSFEGCTTTLCLFNNWSLLLHYCNCSRSGYSICFFCLSCTLLFLSRCSPLLPAVAASDGRCRCHCRRWCCCCPFNMENGYYCPAAAAVLFANLY